MSQSKRSAEQPPRVLMIDDSDLDRRWLRARLAEDAMELVEAEDGVAGLELCRSDPPDLILLDLSLPDCDGFEILRRLKNDRRTGAIPVIVLSGACDTQDKARGLDLGAVDYVTKPFDIIELRARIRVAMRTKRLQDLLEQRAHVDGLTGLANRLALEERLNTDWGIHRRHGGALAVFVADLDHFKAVNDTYGHPTGDEILRRTGEILRASVRTTDLAARYGGEEFVVVAPHCKHTGIFKTAERFRERLATSPVIFNGERIRVTISIGFASWPEDPATTPGELLAIADRGLYQAKAAGRNRVLRWNGIVSPVAAPQDASAVEIRPKPTRHGHKPRTDPVSQSR
jgi:two-component system, cell cycle response regulator